MNALNKSLEPVLRSAFTESLKNCEPAGDDNFVGGFYLCYDAGNQTLTIFDDAEKELFLLVLNETPVVWGSDALQEIKDTAKYILKGLKDEHVFDKKFISKPFSVSLVDNDFVEEEELFFVDDPTLKSGGDLWSGMNKELDEFLKQLMK